MQKVPTENIEAEMLANWLRLNNYFFTHIANESWLPPKVAMLAAIRKKKMWLTPWVPDFMIILKRWSLLFIELKRKKPFLKNWTIGKSPSIVSEEQKKWVEKLNEIKNVSAFICYGSLEARTKIIEMENF